MAGAAGESEPKPEAAGEQDPWWEPLRRHSDIDEGTIDRGIETPKDWHEMTIAAKKGYLRAAG
jgi:hypothetical protein